MKVRGISFSAVVFAFLLGMAPGTATAAETPPCAEGEVLDFLLKKTNVYESPAADKHEELTFEQVKAKNGGNPVMVCHMTPDNLVEVEVEGKRHWIEAGDVEFDRPVAKFPISDCRQRNTLSEAASAGAVRKCP